MQEVQRNIEGLNISTSDKEKLKHEVENLNKEQRDLQGKIEMVERELHNERSKKVNAERKLNEMDI